MSRFSSQLRTALERCHMSRAELATASGLPYSTLTNYARDTRTADPKAMLAICKAFPEDEAAHLLVARLCDERPDEFSGLVSIEPRAQMLEEPQPMPFPDLDRLTRDAIEVLARAAAKNEAWHDVVLDLASVIAPERFRRE